MSKRLSYRHIAHCTATPGRRAAGTVQFGLEPHFSPDFGQVSRHSHRFPFCFQGPGSLLCQGPHSPRPWQGPSKGEEHGGSRRRSPPATIPFPLQFSLDFLLSPRPEGVPSTQRGAGGSLRSSPPASKPILIPTVPYFLPSLAPLSPEKGTLDGRGSIPAPRRLTRGWISARGPRR